MSPSGKSRVAGLVAGSVLLLAAAGPSIAGIEAAAAHVLSRMTGPFEEMEVVSPVAPDTPSIAMEPRDGAFDEGLRSPAAVVIVGGFPWEPLAAGYDPQKKSKNLRDGCVGGLADCYATTQKFCKDTWNSSASSMVYMAPGADEKYPHGKCAASCLNGKQGEGKMCGSDGGKNADPPCPCQADPCKWGTDSCCPGIPPEWCAD